MKAWVIYNIFNTEKPSGRFKDKWLWTRLGEDMYLTKKEALEYLNNPEFRGGLFTSDGKPLWEVRQIDVKLLPKKRKQNGF